VAAFGAMMFLGLGLHVNTLGGRTPDLLAWFAVASALIVGGFATAERAGTVRTPRIFLLLGAASYAIYLIHSHVELVIIKMLLALGARAWMHPVMVFVVIIVGAIVAGVILHIVVERPILARGRAAIRSWSSPRRDIPTPAEETQQR